MRYYKNMMRKRRIYLDYAAATPVDKRVVRAMRPYDAACFANPSSIHEEGVVARRAVEAARTTIARLLNIRSEEVIFTSGGTEADNLALFGVVKKARQKGIETPHIVTTNIEHPAVLEACRQLEQWGIKVTYVPVEVDGVVDPKKVAAALRPETVVVSVQLANSEIGTIQPLHDIARYITEYKATQNKNDERALGVLEYPYFHTDASQAANYLDINFQKYGVDLMTLDAAKIYGPKGVGLLAAKRQVLFEPSQVGGGQERGRRAGTENVPAIVGFSVALNVAANLREKESKRLALLQKYFIKSLEEFYPNRVIIINGNCQKCLPNTVTVCIRNGQEAELAVIRLDALGIACSAGSACTNLSTAAYSYVIEAIKPECKNTSIRFSFGRQTSRRELDLTLRAMRSII